MELPLESAPVVVGVGVGHGEGDGDGDGDGYAVGNTSSFAITFDGGEP